jgi:hypothetical protein
MGNGRLAAKRRQLQNTPISELADMFGQWAQIPTDGPEGSRKRLFTLSRTLWLFLSQTLAADKSCRETVRKALAWLALVDGKVASPSTAAYCKARIRLPKGILERVNRNVIDRLEARNSDGDLWYGRRVKVVDGSSLSMPDTPENQHRYPQPSGQKRGCGFPVMRIVVVFSLATGAALDWAREALSVDERSLFRRLWPQLQAGDAILADRGFCSYADIWLLMRQGVDSVMRKHQARTTGVRPLRNLGRGDRLVEWLRGYARPKWLTLEEWRAIPLSMTLRELTFVVPIKGFRTKSVTLATSLLDHCEFPREAFANLYEKRWMVELFLRDIKTSMGADVLRCRTPSMVEKELEMFLLAYNLTRAVMCEAADRHGIDRFCLSFSLLKKICG